MITEGYRGGAGPAGPPPRTGSGVRPPAAPPSNAAQPAPSSGCSHLAIVAGAMAGLCMALTLAGCAIRSPAMGEGIWLAPRHLEQERAR